MLKLSQRAQNVISSPIRKFLPLVLQAEKRGVTVFKLNVGDPDIPTSPKFWQALKNYKQKTINYAASPGIREHTEAWVKYFSHFGVSLKTPEVIPTVGGAEAILLTLMAAADPGDEIIVFEPLYSSYKGFAAMCNLKLVPITLKVENNFALPNAHIIAKKITKKTKAIIIVNPNNPTGTILTTKEINEIIKVAKRHKLFIIADETYRDIIFKGKPHTFLNEKSASQNVIIVDSTSKRFSCPGARIGCVASHNKKVMAAILKFAMVRLSAPTLEQYSLIPLLRNPRPFTQEITKEYLKRRQVVVAALKNTPGITFHEPQGAFYLIVKLPVKNSEDFVKFLLNKFSLNKKTVLVTPAEDFYITPGLGRKEIRLAYVINTKHLAQAMEILRLALKKYSSPKQQT